MPGFRALALSDAEIISDYILPARAFVERSGPGGGQRVEPSFSRSTMKSVDANIARGSEAMNKAILEKADQHRAMHRAGLGSVDFVWGDDKRGIAHILAQRQAKDGMTRQGRSSCWKKALFRPLRRGRKRAGSRWVTLRPCTWTTRGSALFGSGQVATMHGC